MGQKAQEYINKLYIDYGDLNEKAEEQIKQAFIDGMKEQLLIQDVVCCGALEELDIRWMYLDDQTKCMPHIKNVQKDKDYRVNFCPVCGKNVRSVMIKP